MKERLKEWLRWWLVTISFVLFVALEAIAVYFLLHSLGIVQGSLPFIQNVQ